MQFEVGDRVRIDSDRDGGRLQGIVTVLEVDAGAGMYYVHAGGGARRWFRASEVAGLAWGHPSWN